MPPSNHLWWTKVFPQWDFDLEKTLKYYHHFLCCNSIRALAESFFILCILNHLEVIKWNEIMNFLDEARTKKEDQQLFFVVPIESHRLPSVRSTKSNGRLNMWRWWCGRIAPCSTRFASRHGQHLSTQQFNLSKTHGCILSMSARYLWNVVVVASSVDSQICTNFSVVSDWLRSKWDLKKVHQFVVFLWERQLAH